MPHQEYNIDTHHEGEATLIPVTVRDSNDNRVDISTAAIEWNLKDSQTTDDIDATLTKTVSGGGITIVDGAAGECEIKIATGDTSGLVPQGQENEEMYHNCWVDIDGDDLVVFHGTFLITNT